MPDELDRIVAGDSTMKLWELRDEYDSRDPQRRYDWWWLDCSFLVAAATAIKLTVEACLQ